MACIGSRSTSKHLITIPQKRKTVIIALNNIIEPMNSSIQNGVSPTDMMGITEMQPMESFALVYNIYSRRFHRLPASEA